MTKKKTKDTHFKVLCTVEQRERAHTIAKSAGAASLSEYALTLILEGNTEKYGTSRRKAEGPLINAQLYYRLGEMVDALKATPSNCCDLVQEAIAFLHEIRREIVLNRHNTDG
jgi:HPt (histidine-containing phosphotransfer) domain-containing protein